MLTPLLRIWPTGHPPPPTASPNTRATSCAIGIARLCRHNPWPSVPRHVGEREGVIVEGDSKMVSSCAKKKTRPARYPY